MCYPFDIKECEEYTDKRKKISAVENKRTYSAENKNRKLVSLIRIDNCIIKEGVRCDYLLLDCDKKNSYFIELKGKNLLHAIEQIDQSIDLLIDKISGYTVNARIVLRRTPHPDIRSSKYKTLEKKLKKYNGNLLKKNIILEEYI